MMLLSLAALVLALGVVVLVAALVPTINELKKTIVTVREFIVTTDNSLQVVLSQLGKTLSDVREMTDAAALRREDITTLMTALGDTGENVHKLNGVIGGAVRAIEKPTLYWAGVKAAAQSILGNITKKRGN